MSQAAWEAAMGMRGYSGSPAEREARKIEKARNAPAAGHKCKGAQFGVKVNCECGWSSSTWYGKGARSNAYGEWRMHTDACKKQHKE